MSVVITARHVSAAVALSVVGVVAVAALLVWRNIGADPQQGQGRVAAQSDPTTEATAPVPKSYVTARTSYAKSGYSVTSPDSARTATLAGFPPERFARLDLVTPDSSAQSSARLLMKAVVSVNGTKESGSGQEGYWEACLAQGALADRLAGSAADLDQVVAARDVEVEFSDGRLAEEGGCGGDVSPGQLFGAQADGSSDDAIVRSVDDALSTYGLTPVEVTVLHPLGPAVSVVATMSDPDLVSGKLNDVQDAILGSPYRYEGLYLEIRDPAGEPLVRTDTAFRAGTGSVWFAPGMDKQFGITHGGLAP